MHYVEKAKQQRDKVARQIRYIRNAVERGTPLAIKARRTGQDMAAMAPRNVARKATAVRVISSVERRLAMLHDLPEVQEDMQIVQALREYHGI